MFRNNPESKNRAPGVWILGSPEDACPGTTAVNEKSAAGLLPPRPFLYLAGPGAETPVAKTKKA
jgi:hypothetical protein